MLLDLQEIYNMGGRKFAIQSVGPLGCLPVIKAVHPDTNGSCVKNFLTHASLHNKALSNQLSKMAKELSGFKYSIMDYFFNLLYRINYPTKYGKPTYSQNFYTFIPSLNLM